MEQNKAADNSGEVIETEDFDYDGFQVVRGEFFAHTYEPSFIFNNSKFYVNSACINRLPDIDYVQIWVNSDKKVLAIKPCDESDKDSFKWKTGTKKIVPKKISCQIFYAKIYSLMGWNFNNRYKLLGKLVHTNGEYLFVFDLKTPEIFERKNVDGKESISRKASFPEDWKNHFGISVKEHQKNLQISIYNGYAVYSIQNKDQEDNDGHER